MTARLNGLVKSLLGKPVEWGIDDCLLTAMNVSEAITGRDPAPTLRNLYHTKMEAMRVIKEFGGDDYLSVIGAVASKLGYPEIAAVDAVAGDIGILVEKDLPATACRIEQGWLLRAEFGIAIRPTVLRAWSVACRC